MTAGFSLAASTTSAAPAAASSAVPVWMRPSTAAGASAGRVPFFTCRSRLARIVAVAFSSAAGAVSIRATSQPCCAKHMGDSVAHRARPDDGGSVHVGSFPAHLRAKTIPRVMASVAVASSPPSGPKRRR